MLRFRGGSSSDAAKGIGDTSRIATLRAHGRALVCPKTYDYGRSPDLMSSGPDFSRLAPKMGSIWTESKSFAESSKESELRSINQSLTHVLYKLKSLVLQPWAELI